MDPRYWWKLCRYCFFGNPFDKHEVSDKSKANTIAKAIVCCQTIWFLVQCAARTYHKLPLSLAEKHAAIQVLQGAFMYGINRWMWIGKLSLPCRIGPLWLLKMIQLPLKLERIHMERLPLNLHTRGQLMTRVLATILSLSELKILFYPLSKLANIPPKCLW